MNHERGSRLTAESWRQYCLLKRRMEWLELINSRQLFYRPSDLDALNARFSDVSMNVREFGQMLADGEIKA